MWLAAWAARAQQELAAIGHLYRIFPKLGVHSRAELPDVLPGS
jgi:hypothetical protein